MGEDYLRLLASFEVALPLEQEREEPGDVDASLAAYAALCSEPSFRRGVEEHARRQSARARLPANASFLLGDTQVVG